MTAPAARLAGVRKSFRGATALDDVTLDIPRDAVVGLLGRNGAGKTTIMRLLTGHLLPDRGTVEVEGQPPFENAAVLARMCFVREGQRYPDTVTVAQVLRAAAWVVPTWDAGYAHRLAEDFGLPARRRVTKLSRGMLSAVGIVVGLASRAPVTFFDEPYLGLDPVARQMFYDHLVADYAAHPRTIVLSTHLVDEVSDLLEHVVVVDRGRIVLDDAAEALRGRGAVVTGPAEAVGRLIGDRPVLHRETLGSTVRASVEWPLGPDDRDGARRGGLHVEPLSLQQLLVRLTATPPSARERPRDAVTGTPTDLLEGAAR
jgi:ABC-2 type transport system ATP-binding protein